MKNIAIYALMLIGLACGLGACTGDYAQPPVVLPEGGIGNGNWDYPLTAYQASLGATPSDRTENWVKGYIVGWIDVNVTNVLKKETARFDIPATVNTNILIAATPEETDWEKCVPVQLPSGNVRNALNLAANPDAKGQLVCLYGTTGSKYCSAYGVRSVTDYKWGDVGNEPDPSMILPDGSRTVWTVTLTTDMQGFTFDQGTPWSDDTWKHSTQYGLVATAGRSGSAAVTDAMAISPEIDLTNYVNPRMLVHQAANYFGDSQAFNEMTSTMVREAGTGNWVRMEVPILPAGNSWGFSDSGYINLDQFAGKKIQIGFRYTSTKDLSGTWEIDKVTVTGVYSRPQ